MENVFNSVQFWDSPNLQAMCQFCTTKYVLSTAQLMTQVMCDKPIPLAARSKAWVCDCSLAGIAGSNPTGAWVSVCCECCVLPSRGLCDELITVQRSPTECVCVLVWSWSLDNDEALAHWGVAVPWRKVRLRESYETRYIYLPEGH